MFALIYLFLLFLLGDAICRRFFSFISIQHRLAVAFLSGLLISTWITYAAALVFAHSTLTLLWANLIFLVIAVAFILWLRRGVTSEQPGDGSLRKLFKKIVAATSVRVEKSDQKEATTQDSEIPIRFDADRRPVGNAKWDWACLIICLIFTCWLMFSTLNFSDGNFQFGLKGWSDFGANLSLSQSMAVGHNFPTEHPFLPGEFIRYHFLFWFQAANLSFLGLNLAWSINLLSVLSLMSLVVMIMTFAELLFSSRAVARISAIFFFFSSSSLSYVPFLWSQASLSGMLSSIVNLKEFLNSGYPFRGEGWGALSVAVFGNQRHFISGVAILFIVLVFLIDFYRCKGVIADLEHNPTASSGDEKQTGIESDDNSIRQKNETVPEYVESQPDPPRSKISRSDITALIFCGLLIGALPYWNSAVFVSAVIIIGSLLVFFPYRRYLTYLIGTSILFGLPQLLMLQSGNFDRTSQSLFHWGYTIINPTVPLVLEYLGWTFGLKWILLLVALWFLPGAHRRLFLVFSTLIPVVFLLQLSVDVFNNHKLLNVWNIAAFIYVAFALWIIGKANAGRAVLAVGLGLAMAFGAIIDLFPVHNDFTMNVPYENDRLTTWLFENTQPTDLFLTDRLLSHPILFTGRKIFLGNPLFPWAVGYDISARENTYRRMFQERDPNELVRLLNENKIAFVAIEDGLRGSDFVRNINESVYKQNFEKVFDDTEHKYANLAIYKVPADLSSTVPDRQEKAVDRNVVAEEPAVSAFASGQGNGPGQFSSPRGIAVDTAGNFYVADTMNARVQKFSPEGNFLAAIGTAGSGEGQLREPDGIAVDSVGNIYVADALNHRLLKFKPDGTFVKEWTGPAPGFFGPRSVVIGPDKRLYVLDQGNSRVVVVAPESDKIFAWGTQGTGEGEFAEPTGLEVGGDRVYVTDAGNLRIQIFDLNGKFIAQWAVPEWTTYPWRYPAAAFDPQDKRLYVTNPQSKEILVFDVDGNRLESLKPSELNALENPSALVVSNTKAGKRLYVLNTGSSNVYVFELRMKENKDKITNNGKTK